MASSQHRADDRTPARRRRLISLGVGAIASLALLELVLQIGHLFVCTLHAGDEIAPIQSADRVVLCVGDSFTWGIGASSPELSYPAQLEQLLRDRMGPEWRVINGGWPGQNSRDALLRLDAQLAAWRPEVVCFVIGINDLWSRPTEAHRSRDSAQSPDDSATAGNCRLAWRTGRLFLWVKNVFLGSPLADRQPPAGETDPTPGGAGTPATAIVGSWRNLGESAVFREDGTARYGALDLRWTIEGDRLILSADGSPDLVLSWRHIGQQLILKPISGDRETVLLRLEDFVESRIAASRFAVEDGNPGLAEYIVNEIAVAQEPDAAWAPRAHLAKHGVLRAMKRVAEAEAELQWLRDRHEQSPGSESAGCLLEALVTAGELAEARRLADSVTDSYADSDRLWHAVALLAKSEGQAAAARRAIDRAANLARGHPRWQARVHRSRADLYAGTDDGESLQSLLRAYALDRDRAATERRLRAARSRIGPELLERSLADPLLDEDAGAELRALLAGGSGARTEAVLRSHLMQMIERVRAAGGEPVIGSYPSPGFDFYEMLTEVCAATGTAWVPIYEEFRGVLAADPDRELFVADGHCNDAGYGVMARALAGTVVERVRGR